MKASVAIVLFLLGLSLPCQAQTQPSASKATNTTATAATETTIATNVQPQQASADTTSQNNSAVITTPPPMPKVVKPAKRGEVSGFLADVARTNHPIRLLDLRTPVDPIKDNSNVSTNPMTGRPAGFRLLSIRF